MLKTIPELIALCKDNIQTVSVAEALNNTDKCVIIDVREPTEFLTKALNNSINIPRGMLEMKMVALYPDENTKIFIHCATGARAVLATEQLTRVGYKNVKALTCTLDDLCSAQD